MTKSKIDIELPQDLSKNWVVTEFRPAKLYEHYYSPVSNTIAEWCSIMPSTGYYLIVEHTKRMNKQMLSCIIDDAIKQAETSLQNIVDEAKARIKALELDNFND